MSKLSELTNGPRTISVLLQGQPGAGKSVAAASFPSPILLLDFDGKADSIAMYYRNSPELLENVDVRNLAARLGTDPMQEFVDIVDKELVPASQQEGFPYKTIILDSITTFSSLCLQHIIKTNPGLKRPTSKQGAQPTMADYGILRREFQRLIPGLLGLPCNVVMTAHVHIEKDDMTGELHRRPLMDGSFAEQLPIYFKEVYRTYVTDKGEYMWQTKSDRKFNLRSQIPGLPKDVIAGYPILDKHLHAGR